MQSLPHIPHRNRPDWKVYRQLVRERIDDGGGAWYREMSARVVQGAMDEGARFDQLRPALEEFRMLLGYVETSIRSAAVRCAAGEGPPPPLHYPPSAMEALDGLIKHAADVSGLRVDWPEENACHA